MKLGDFLIQAADNILGGFNIPILDKEPIWKILNAHKTFIYAYKTIDKVQEICEIPLEEFTKMLSKSNDDEEVFRYYNVIYLLDSFMYDVHDMDAYNKKMHDQRLSEKLEDFNCDENLKDWQKQDVLSSSTNKPKEKTIWDLKLHESLHIADYKYWVTRVPGGWLYKKDNTSTFVKYVEKKKE